MADAAEGAGALRGRVWIPLDQYFGLHQETCEARAAAERVREKVQERLPEFNKLDRYADRIQAVLRKRKLTHERYLEGQRRLIALTRRTLLIAGEYDELVQDALRERISCLLKFPVEGTPNDGQFASIRIAPAQIHSITAIDIPNRAVAVGAMRFEYVAVYAPPVKKPPPSVADLTAAIEEIMVREDGRGRRAKKEEVIAALCEGRFSKHNQRAVRAGVEKNWKRCSLNRGLTLHEPGHRGKNPSE